VSHEERKGPSVLSCAVASLAVALVLALTILSASPDLHARLHGNGPGAAGAAHHDLGRTDGGQAADDEDGCVVTLFAQGVVLALALLVLALAGRTLRLTAFGPGERVIPAAPRYLRLPTQAPPVGLS
jgi:hypothetical protein